MSRGRSSCHGEQRSGHSPIPVRGNHGVTSTINHKHISRHTHHSVLRKLLHMHVDGLVVDAAVYIVAAVNGGERVELIRRFKPISIVVHANKAVVLAHRVGACFGNIRDLCVG